MLRSKLLEHSNLVQYAEKLKTEFMEAGSSSSSVPRFPAEPSSSTSRRGPSNWSKILSLFKFISYHFNHLNFDEVNRFKAAFTAYLHISKPWFYISVRSCKLLVLAYLNELPFVNNG